MKNGTPSSLLTCRYTRLPGSAGSLFARDTIHRRPSCCRRQDSLSATRSRFPSTCEEHVGHKYIPDDHQKSGRNVERFSSHQTLARASAIVELEMGSWFAISSEVSLFKRIKNVYRESCDTMTSVHFSARARGNTGSSTHSASRLPVVLFTCICNTLSVEWNHGPINEAQTCLGISYYENL